MLRCLSILTAVFLSACATFDKTHITSDQRVPGYGFSFSVPTETPWFAVVYGNSHRIRLSQINEVDSYTIQVSLNRGPRGGMYTDAQSHLTDIKASKQQETIPKGFIQFTHNEWLEPRYGKLCVQYTSFGEDHRGRLNKGPAKVELAGLTCQHESLDNVLINFEITRRSDANAPQIDVAALANSLFASIEYEDVD